MSTNILDGIVQELRSIHTTDKLDPPLTSFIIGEILLPNGVSIGAIMSPRTSSRTLTMHHSIQLLPLLLTKFFYHASMGGMQINSDGRMYELRGGRARWTGRRTTRFVRILFDSWVTMAMFVVDWYDNTSLNQIHIRHYRHTYDSSYSARGKKPGNDALLCGRGQLLLSG